MTLSKKGRCGIRANGSRTEWEPYMFSHPESLYSHLLYPVIPELRNEMSGISCHVDVSYSIPWERFPITLVPRCREWRCQKRADAGYEQTDHEQNENRTCFRIPNLSTLICSISSFQNWGTKYLESHVTLMCHIQYFERDSLSRSFLAVGNDVVKV